MAPASAARIAIVLMSQLRSSAAMRRCARSLKVVVPGSAPRKGRSPRNDVTASKKTRVAGSSARKAIELVFQMGQPVRLGCLGPSRHRQCARHPRRSRIECAVSRARRRAFEASATIASLDGVTNPTIPCVRGRDGGAPAKKRRGVNALGTSREPQTNSQLKDVILIEHSKDSMLQCNIRADSSARRFNPDAIRGASYEKSLRLLPRQVRPGTASSGVQELLFADLR
jgi:hypothetical protein